MQVTTMPVTVVTRHAISRLLHQHCWTTLGAHRRFRCNTVCTGRRSAKIAGRKGAQDSHKAKLFGKIGKQVIQAVREGGADYTANQVLKQVLRSASLAGVPRDIIDRNVKRATDKSQDAYEHILLEIYGAGGVGLVCDCLTDKKERATHEIRTVLNRVGGKMAEQGSVLFKFGKAGLIFLEPSMSEDAAVEAALDAGADDVQPVHEDGELVAFKLTTSPETYAAVHQHLQEQHLPIQHDRSGISYVPHTTVECDDAALEQNRAMLDRLMEIDDVDNVFSTAADLHA